MSAELFLFDDRAARKWLPFALTRPVGEMLFGTRTLRGRAERATGLECRGHVTSRDLVGFCEPEAPPIATPESVRPDRDRLLLSSRLVLNDTALAGERGPAEPRLLAARGTPAGAWIPAGTPFPSCARTGDYPDWPAFCVDGWLLESAWELMDKNGEQICSDHRRSGLDGRGAGEPPLPPGVHCVGDGPLVIDPGADVEPGVVFDTTNGPVILASGVRVRGFSRIAGPAYVGPGSTVLGGAIENSSLGPWCKVRGDVESSVLLGFANKAHEGYLGHSVLGRWVNLGAMTTVSALKNNYGPIRAVLRGRAIDTGLRKAGCLLGDHVRTAIGTMLATGTIAEAGANLFGARTPPKYVAPFSWGAGPNPDEYDIERFLETARRVMARRDVQWEEGMERLYRNAFSTTASQRASAAAGPQSGAAGAGRPE